MMLASVASWRDAAEAREGTARQQMSKTASDTRRTDVTGMGLSLGIARPTKAHELFHGCSTRVPEQSIAGTLDHPRIVRGPRNLKVARMDFVQKPFLPSEIIPQNVLFPLIGVAALV